MRGSLVVAVLMLAPLSGCTLGNFPADAGSLSVRSATIPAGEPIPAQHTCDGRDTSPPLTVGDLPQGTQTVALVVEDADAPGEEPFVHWLVWNVPASGGTASVPEDAVPRGAVEGTNGNGEVGWTGPCPPSEDGPHTYDVVAYAVDRSLPIDEGADRGALEEALRGHVLAEGRLSTIYDR